MTSIDKIRENNVFLYILWLHNRKKTSAIIIIIDLFVNICKTNFLFRSLSKVDYANLYIFLLDITYDFIVCILLD